MLEMPHTSVTDQMLDNARQLRKTMTKAEQVLWQMVRAYRLDGFAFRRQVPIGQYIADFVCHGARLIIEIDGMQHREPSAAGADRTRAAWFRSRGYRVLRFTNDEVVDDRDRVIAVIRELLADRTGRSPPSQPSPARGEGTVLSPPRNLHRMATHSVLKGGRIWVIARAGKMH